jgi:hypothetical protein
LSRYCVFFAVSDLSGFWRVGWMGSEVYIPS